MLYHTSVPAANLSNSKTPIGPFHMMVFVVFKASPNVLMESGPISRPIQPSGMLDAGTVCKVTHAKKLTSVYRVLLGHQLQTKDYIQNATRHFS